MVSMWGAVNRGGRRSLRVLELQWTAGCESTTLTTASGRGVNNLAEWTYNAES
jgi:hypothetical protein